MLENGNFMGHPDHQNMQTTQAIYIYHTHLTVYANIFIYCVYNVYVDMENVLDTCCKGKTTNQ